MGFTGRYDRPVGASNADIRDTCIKIVKERDLWERFFAENGIEPVRLEYEDIAKDVSYLNRIVERLGVRRDRLNADRSLTRLSNSVNEEMYQRFMNAGGQE